MKNRARLWALSCCVMLVLAACGGSTTPISEILKNPRAFEGKQVTVDGDVVEVFGLVVLKYFVVKDAGGEIAVVTERSLPKKGERATVTGKVREAFAIGDRQLIVIMEDAEKR